MPAPLGCPGEHQVSAIVTEIGHSTPSVSKIVREMSKEGIVMEKKDKNDGRKNTRNLLQKERR